MFLYVVTLFLTPRMYQPNLSPLVASLLVAVDFTIIELVLIEVVHC